MHALVPKNRVREKFHEKSDDEKISLDEKISSSEKTDMARKTANVENTLKFIKLVMEEIFQKFGQRINDIRADGGSEFARRIEAPATRSRQAKKTTWFKNQEIVLNDLTKFLEKNGINLSLFASQYTNKNRVVDRAIRTIRDMLGSNPNNFFDSKLV
jgi:hypothetical protein